MKLAVLDQSPIASGCTPQQALEQSTQLAIAAEQAGYDRYWVAEHHGSASFAGCAPEILIGHLAANTNRMRIGSGGVMLMHYSPLKVAEQFKLLQSLYPNRIDLGVGRAPGSDAITMAALAYGSKVGPEYFPARFADLLAFIAGDKPFSESLAGVNPAPAVDVPPEVWMLGSSKDGARLAAHFGVPFSYAHFINDGALEAACEVYRRDFRPSRWLNEPRVGVGVFAIAAENPERAQELALCRDLWRIKFERGSFEPFPSVEEAMRYPFTDEDRAAMENRRKRQILGTPDEVAVELTKLTTSVDADELAIVSITHDFQDRVRSHVSIAEALRGHEILS